MKPQETLFQERGWAQGRPGACRETQREKPGCWASGTGKESVKKPVPVPGTFPGPLPEGNEGPPESATLKGKHRKKR